MRTLGISALLRLRWMCIPAVASLLFLQAVLYGLSAVHLGYTDVYIYTMVNLWLIYVRIIPIGSMVLVYIC